MLCLLSEVVRQTAACEQSGVQADVDIAEVLRLLKLTHTSVLPSQEVQ